MIPNGERRFLHFCSSFVFSCRLDRQASEKRAAEAKAKADAEEKARQADALAAATVRTLILFGIERLLQFSLIG